MAAQEQLKETGLERPAVLAQGQRDLSAAAESGEGTSRLEAFSDGVFSIAITLLILNIHVPTEQVSQQGGSAREMIAANLFASLLKDWPTYATYLVSFVTIGIIWINHHISFRYIQRTDRGLLILNSLLLLFVSFIPFPNALLARSLSDNREIEAATAIYGAVMSAMAISFSLLWLYASRRHRLIDRSVDLSLLAHKGRRNLFGNVLYLLTIPLAFVYYPASLAVFAFVAIFYLLPAPTDRF